MTGVGSIRMVFTKWGDRPHWEYDTELLGDDEHGRWLGLREGSEVSRPGARITTTEPQVVLVPDAAYVATFYDAGPAPCDVYVDISSVPSMAPGRVTAVDLDLDILRGRTGRVWVDDQDEFADHRVRYAYPDDLVEAALVSCAGVRADVDARRPPFDGVTARRWLDRLAQTPGPGSHR
jgi:protein associated with RNAse G/E